MADEQSQLEFRRRLKSMVVDIRCTLPYETYEDRIEYQIVGTIVHKGDGYLYVIVKQSLVFPGASYHITLPDGSQMDIKSEDFSVPKVKSLFSGFYVNHKDLKYDTNQVAQAEFGEDVTMFQKVHLCDFFNTNFNTTDGYVFGIDDQCFRHTCGPTPYTGNGAPVFDEQGRLVGISISNMQGPSVALLMSIVDLEMHKIVHEKDTLNFSFLIDFHSP